MHRSCGVKSPWSNSVNTAHSYQLLYHIKYPDISFWWSVSLSESHHNSYGQRQVLNFVVKNQTWSVLDMYWQVITLSRFPPDREGGGRGRKRVRVRGGCHSQSAAHLQQTWRADEQKTNGKAAACAGVLQQEGCPESHPGLPASGTTSCWTARSCCHTWQCSLASHGTWRCPQGGSAASNGTLQGCECDRQIVLCPLCREPVHSDLCGSACPCRCLTNHRCGCPWPEWCLHILIDKSQ